MANPNNLVIHAVPETGGVVLPITKAMVVKVAVSGTDLVLLLTDGTQHVLRDFAMRMLTQPGLKVVFADVAVTAAELFGNVGKVAFAQLAAQLTLNATSEPLAVPVLSPAPRPPVQADDAPAPAASSSEADPSTPALPAPPGLADLQVPVTREAAFNDDNPPATPQYFTGRFSDPASASGPIGVPPPPPPPADTISLAASWHNVTGQTTGTQEGKPLITGSGGSERSATDYSSEAQAEREIITGTAGDDVIVGDNTAQLGTGFARVLDLQLSARAALDVKTLTLSGLPTGFVVVGATVDGIGWKVTLPADFAATGYRVSLTLQYAVANDGTVFTPSLLDLSLSATGTMEGKDISGNRVIPGVLRDVTSSTDLEYSLAGKDGIVFPAFGLGDEIYAGAGNDTVRAGVGHDVVHGDAGNDNLDGGAGNDVLEGGDGADVLTGGTGNDTAAYASSETGVAVDLARSTATGGQAEGDTLTAIENLSGSYHADTLRGDSAANRLLGAEGDDTLEGRGGADLLEGGEGFDRADYSASASAVTINLATGAGQGGDAEGDRLVDIEGVIGSTGNDRLTGDANSNLLQGGAGTDTLEGAAGADALDGGAGTDTATYANAAAAVEASLDTGTGSAGEAQGDTLQDIENLTGSRFNDVLTGNAGANTLAGGAGDDYLEGGAAADSLIGGDGRDTASYLQAVQGVVVSLENPTSNTSDALGDTFQGIENLEGSEFDDVLTGDAQANWLYGGPGDDTLNGKAGNDLLFSGAGRDTLDGGDGTDAAVYSSSSESVNANLALGRGQGGDAEGDTYAAIENLTGSRYADTLVGDTANNTLEGGRGNDVLAGGAGADQLLGGDGSDTADYSASSGAVRIDLTAALYEGGDAVGDRLESVENIAGTSSADRLVGSAAANTLAGGGGDDVLEGRAGNDNLQGGDGDDLLLGGQGGDTLAGGQGADTASYAGTAEGVIADLVTNRGQRGDAEGDTYSGIENLVGSDGDDRLSGTADANQLTGGNGNDTLEGGAGADTLDGGDGSDTASYARAASGVTANLVNPAGGNGDAQGDRYTSIENLLGSTFADVLRGDLEANRLAGGDGDDLLVGGAGADTLVGGEGADTADYGASATAVQIDLESTTAQTGGDAEGDLLQGIESLQGTRLADTLRGDVADNRLAGGAGNDLLEGRAGADVLEGGDGTDTASYASAASAVLANLANAAQNTGDAAGDSYTDIENLSGGAFDDNLLGDSGDNRLEGNDGDDTLQGGTGSDVLVGGLGSDTASYASAASSLVISLAAPDTNTGEAAGDAYTSIENLRGSAFEDSLTGNDSANKLFGGVGADWLVGNGGADTLDGGAGTDTASYAASRSGVTANLASGQGGGGDAQGDRLVSIENLVGSAFDDTLAGNSLANRLEGGEGNDTVDGGLGGDVLRGGLGDDTYGVDNESDVVFEAAAEGTDTVRASVSYALTANVEDLVLVGTDDIDGTGTAVANQITGNSGNNRLDGGAGADTLSGSAGDDTYVVDNSGDQTLEEDGAGTDTVISSITWRLGESIENLVLTGSADTNATGNVLANSLAGNSGNNRLDGGSGADRMAGGAGDDIYTVDNVGDVVQELAGEGYDLVRAGANHTLAANVEALELTGAGNFNATGNSSANTLVGNSGNNRLDGGLGADNMQGGAGNDTYVVDNAGDVVAEQAGEGTDTVESGRSLVLGAHLENLTLTGTDDLDATGNGLDNLLLGNDGNNLLDGGAGADTLEGGAGNDTYTVDNIDDLVTEDAGNGTDTVGTSVSYGLTANVENLLLTGSAAINGTGNDANNQITGNSANNRLDGGRGADRLVGGAGDDTYVLDNAADVALELLGEGLDTVRTSVSWTLGSNFETLVLTGNSGINATGNELANLLLGNGGNNTLDGGLGDDTLVGGGGDDTYLIDSVLDVATETAGEGIDTVRTALGWVLGEHLDNLVLTGTAAVNGTGNGLDNVITGNSAANLLDGGEGADVLAGGDGNDTYFVDNVADQVVEGAGIQSGLDTVNATVSTLLGQNVERLVLLGNTAIDGSGNELNNTLTGNSANNVLDGGAGDDVMTGGGGDDTYVVDSAGDFISEAPGGGVDTVRTQLTYVLGANFENLELIGSDTADITGNLVDNVLTGNSANNVLDGMAGADTLVGGAGDDIYAVDNSADQVVELFDEGEDLVRSSVSYALSANVERLQLTGTDNLDGMGNAQANVITGNQGNNTLDGGLGADSLVGGRGDDTYIVDNLADQVAEAAAEGLDVVRSSVSWALGNHFENLVLTGNGNIDGTGNTQANVITGNSGANTLDGGGGADTLVGAGGNDSFTLPDLALTSADGGAGTDTLFLNGAGLTSLTGLMGKVSNIEVLDFTGGLADVVEVRAAQVNSPGFLGSDAAGKLEIVLDGPTAGNDVLILSASEYNNVTTVNDAPAVFLANGNAGRLLTAVAPGSANLAIDFGTLVLPVPTDLISVWGRVADPSSVTGIGGLATWLDATDLDGDGNAEGLLEAGVVNASGNLTQWTDKSGNGNNFVPLASASSQPSLVSSGINAKASVRFDGNDSLVSSTSFGQTYTVFVVGAMQGTQNGRLVASSTTNELIGWWNGSQNNFHSAGWVTLQQTPVVAGEASLFAATGANGSGYLWNNGNRLPLSSAAVKTNEDLGKVQLGGGYFGNLGESSKGDIAELLVYDHALTDGERRAVESYLRTKWSVGGAAAPSPLGVMGTIALDRTWTSAKLLYGTTGTDTINVSYTATNPRGTGRVDAVVFGGAGNDTLNGNDRVDAIYGGDGNDALDGGLGGDWLAGGAGNDTYAVDNTDDTVLEEAGAGTDTVNSLVTYALPAHIENLTLTGTANIDGTGNALNNTLTGNAGANRLDGGAGADAMVGGAGDDIYTVDNLGDVITDTAGNDTVRTGLTGYTLAAGVEILTMTGTTDATVFGNSGNNTINSSLYGGRLTASGGAGDDTYVMAQDPFGISPVRYDHVFIENPGEGNDRISVTRNLNASTVINFTLPNNIEILDLFNTLNVNAIGSAGDDQLWGSSRFQTATGNLHSLTGGLGNDIYRAYIPATLVVEAAGEGTDRIELGVDFQMPANIENATALDQGNNFANKVTIIGNSLANTITGNWANNRLDGGAGNDTLTGDKGDDTFVVDSAGDVISDTLGVDTVETSLANYTLPSAFEKLIFTTPAVAHIGTGNTSNNTIVGNTAGDTLLGNDGDDVLIGGTPAGGGVDSLQGGNGNDLLVSQSASLAGPQQVGLRAQYYNNINWLGAPVLVRQEGVALDTAGSPGPGVNTDNFSVRFLGDLRVDTAGVHVFRMKSDDVGKLWIDNQLILSNGYWGTSDSLPITLTAGNHSIRVEAYDGSSGGSALLSWQTPGSGSFAVVPITQYSYGDNTVLDTGGDSLDGGAGDDWLVGGAAADTLNGGAGNDTYVVTSTADTLVELAGGGIDTVQSSASYSVLGTQLENIQLVGTAAIDATGSTANNVLQGNTGVNLLTGDAGNDTLVGNGGADTLLGGAGNDTLTAGGGSLLDGGDDNDTLSLVSLWTPDALAGKALWLDAADVDGDGLREGYAEAGLNLGNQVQVWRDKSGLGRDAVQLDPDSQPVLLMNGLNGMPSVKFDGIGDVISALGLPTLTGNTNSLFWVQNTNNGIYMPLHSGANGAGSWNLIVSAGDGRTDLTGYSNTHSTSAFWTDGAPTPFATAGVAHTTLHNATHTVASINQPFAWNGSLTLAGGYQGTALGGDNLLYWNFAGQLPEVLVTTQTLSSLEQQRVEGYLAWKWGHQAFLPATHLFKTAAPTLAASSSGSLLGGNGNDSLTGGNGNDLLDGGAGTDTLAGGLGNDTYVVDSAADVLAEAIGAGTDTVQTAIAYTLPTNFEALVLSGAGNVNGTGNTGDNTLTGNDGTNTLTGLAGDDTLDGGLGADQLTGGTGNDTYVVDNAADAMTELAGEGTDTVRCSITWTLGSNFENVVLMGTAALDATGNAQNNLLGGNSANNVLDGGAGADTLSGEAGDDTYIFDDGLDVAIEGAGEGNDTVYSSVSTTLAANIETLVLTGTAVLGGGNSGNNTLVGNASNNTLDGGAGTDTLRAGAGDDIYLLDNAGDSVVELASEGDDTVQAGISYTLAVNVENLLLTGASSLSGSGNTSDNRITGNSGNNTLRGFAGNDWLDGGLGSDAMFGGAGDDTFEVNQATDTVTELAGEGTDTVRADVTYTLGAELENLVLTGAAANNATGNALNNQLTGNTAGNTLDGGAGADTLAGGAGNDVYWVDNVGDVLIEFAAEGTDSVNTSVSYTLQANLDNLTLTGSGAINGTGNTSDNTLAGNSGNNVLTGGGGTDTLQGGGGSDRLVVQNATNLASADGGSGDDWLQFLNSGSSIDLSGLLGRVSNIENLHLSNGSDDLGVVLDAAAVAGLADNRDTLALRLDSGDTLNITGTYVETSRAVAGDGSVQASYQLWTGSDVLIPPTSYLNVNWLAPGAPG